MRIPNDGCYTRLEKKGLNQDVPTFCESDPDLLFSINHDGNGYRSRQGDARE